MSYRPLLDDRQCRLFLSDVHEFGYTNVTFDEVRRIADEVHAGTDCKSDVIAMFMCKQMDAAEEMIREANP